MGEPIVKSSCGTTSHSVCELIDKCRRMCERPVVALLCLAVKQNTMKYIDLLSKSEAEVNETGV